MSKLMQMIMGREMGVGMDIMVCNTHSRIPPIAVLEQEVKGMLIAVQSARITAMLYRIWRVSSR